MAVAWLYMAMFVNARPFPVDDLRARAARAGPIHGGCSRAASTSRAWAACSSDRDSMHREPAHGRGHFRPPTTKSRQRRAARGLERRHGGVHWRLIAPDVVVVLNQIERDLRARQRAAVDVRD